jgi:SHS2 domain-containing protein
MLRKSYAPRGKMPYKFIDNVAIADVAFAASGKTMEELFESAGKALMATQVKDLKSVKPQKELDLEINAKDEERLLHDFLQELIFYKDAKLLLFSVFGISIKKTAGGYSLKAKLKGEELDMKKHELLADAKAISWHMFKVEKTEGGWEAFVIVDV